MVSVQGSGVRKGSDGAIGIVGSLRLLRCRFRGRVFRAECDCGMWRRAGTWWGARSTQYEQVQKEVARGWNSWDVHSVTPQVLLPEGLAIHVGMKHNTGEYGDAFLGDALIGSFGPDAPVVTPGPHAWDGSYTRLEIEWKGHKWRVESAHDGQDLVLLVSPLGSKGTTALPGTVVFSVNYLGSYFGTVHRQWGQPAQVPSALSLPGYITARDQVQEVDVYCTCERAGSTFAVVPIPAPYFSAELIAPVGISTGKRRTSEEILTVLRKQKAEYEASITMRERTAGF